MYTNCGLKAKTIKNILRALLGAHTITACAEEPTGGKDGTNGDEPLNYEALIARARQEEKNKLYTKIQGLESENKTLIQNCNGYISKIGELENKLENSKGAISEEEVKNLNNKITTLTAEKEALSGRVAELEKGDPEKEASLRASITAEVEENYKAKLELEKYKSEVLESNKDKLLNSFSATVTGNTKEEIDSALEKAISQSLDIKKELGLVDEEGNPIPPKKSPSPKPPKPKAVNPANNSGSNTLDLEYIRSLDPSSPEYKEFRKQLGLK